MPEALRPSDALLRTFAAVPLPCRVLDAGCGAGRHLAALTRLGFDVVGVDRDPEALTQAQEAAPGAALVPGDAAALPFEDDAFGWVVAFRLLDGMKAAPRAAVLAELRRVLMPGGWLYVAEATAAAPAALTTAMAGAGFVLAEAPVAEPDTDSVPLVRGIYRRVEPGVAG